ncbi:hypothetical protein BD410DRAFT_727504, partial [Rickenella mellea]
STQLVRRKCTDDGCNCVAKNPGLFCGDGHFGCKKGNVYQCNEDGFTSCDFGRRKSCVACGRLEC